MKSYQWAIDTIAITTKKGRIKKELELRKLNFYTEKISATSVSEQKKWGKSHGLLQMPYNHFLRRESKN